VLAGITPRPAAPLVGFSSWYRYYQDITAGRLADDLDAVCDLLDARDLGSCTPVFQIDDGYTKLGDWTTHNTDRFPEGMASFARRIDERGLLPGLWMAPFVCETESRVYAEHPDWLLRGTDGELVCAGSNWSSYWPLDTRNPEAREHIRQSLWTATHEWGFRLLKLDFLFAACMVPHDGLNRGQLMADALDLLRDSVEEGTSFDLCGVPVASALGRTEYCRIGCDVGLDWDDVPYMRLLHRERVSTKRSLGNTRGRAHLDGRAFRNDPDVFFLRRDVKLSRQQRSDLIGADAALGGMFLTSDDVAAWDDAQRLEFDRALAVFVDRER
ncbi:MAG: alpha-galactosidase, partial [Atopobiaceae bacterium]|nr:alpha-galactosidase [Atopobiaceae bacterium]